MFVFVDLAFKRKTSKMADAIGETLRPSPKTLDYDETLVHIFYLTRYSD